MRALPYKWGSGGAERAALLDCAGPEGFDLIVAADCASSGHGTRQLFSPLALARPQAQRSASGVAGVGEDHVTCTRRGRRGRDVAAPSHPVRGRSRHHAHTALRRVLFSAFIRRTDRLLRPESAARRRRGTHGAEQARACLDVIATCARVSPAGEAAPPPGHYCKQAPPGTVRRIHVCNQSSGAAHAPSQARHVAVAVLAGAPGGRARDVLHGAGTGVFFVVGTCRSARRAGRECILGIVRRRRFPGRGGLQAISHAARQRGCSQARGGAGSIPICSWLANPPFGPELDRRCREGRVQSLVPARCCSRSGHSTGA